jgi:hypothetical protein
MLSKSKLQAIKPVKNIFNLYQIKKMIGKKLIIPWKGLNTSPQELKDSSKKIKKKILDSVSQKGSKKLVITTVCLSGILHIINGLDRSTAISMISYKEIEKLSGDDIKVVVIQYSKMSQASIKNLILLTGK